MRKGLYNLQVISKQTIEERATELAQYIIDTKDTVRGAAKKFGISKSTVHKDITVTLRRKNYILANEVKKILDMNKMERHLRGGEATRKKYLTEKAHPTRNKA